MIFLYKTWNRRSLVDCINLDELCDNLFKGFNFTGVTNFLFLPGKLASSLQQCCAACDIVNLADVDLITRIQLQFDRASNIRHYTSRPGRCAAA